MAQVFALYYDGAPIYDFLTTNMSGDPYTWQRTMNADGTITETFELASSSHVLTDAQIMSDVQTLDEIAEKVRLYWESDRYQIPVWFHMKAEDETAKRSIVHSVMVFSRAQGYFNPLLGEGLHHLSCQIVHEGMWESAVYSSAAQAETMTLNGDKVTLESIAGSMPARIRETLITANLGEPITDIWMGIKPTRDGVNITTLLELEGALSSEFEVLNRWVPDHILHKEFLGAFTDVSSGAFTLDNNDILYIGSTSKWQLMHFDLSSVNNNASALTIKHSIGSGSFSNALVVEDGTESPAGTPFAQDGYMRIDRNGGGGLGGGDWAEDDVNGITMYWLKITVSVSLDSISFTSTHLHTSRYYPDNEGKGASPADGTSNNGIMFYPEATGNLQRIVRCTLGSLAGLAPGSLSQYQGKWLVLLRYRLKNITTEADFRLRLNTGASFNSNANRDVDIVSSCEDIYINSVKYNDENYHLVELGEIAIPQFPMNEDAYSFDSDGIYYNFTFDIWGELISGDDDLQLLLDCLILIPSEHIVVIQECESLSNNTYENIAFGEMEDGTLFSLQTVAIDFHVPSGIYSYYLKAALINWAYPIEGGLLVVAGQTATDHTLTDALAIAHMQYYPRHKNFYDAVSS